MSDREEKSSDDDEADFNYQPTTAEIKESELEKANLEAQLDVPDNLSKDGLVKADENVKSKGQSLWEKLKNETPPTLVVGVIEKNAQDDEKRAGKITLNKNVKSSELTNLLSELENNKKLNSISKSRLKWDIFKTQKGISRQLDIKSSNGFISKQNFLYNSKPDSKKDN